METRTSLIFTTQQSIFGYYIDNSQTKTLSCSPGSTVSSVTTAKPALFACQGQVAANVCIDSVAATGTCAPGTLCCGQGSMAGKPACGRWDFGGGKAVHYGCSQSAFTFQAYSTSAPTTNTTATPIPSNTSAPSTGLIIGLVVAGIGLLALIVGLWWCSRRADTWRERRLVEKKTAQLPFMPAIAGGHSAPPKSSSPLHHRFSRHVKSRSLARLSHALKPRVRSKAAPPSPVPLQTVHSRSVGSSSPHTHNQRPRSLVRHQPPPSSLPPAAVASTLRGEPQADLFPTPVKPLVPASEGRVSTFRIDGIPSQYRDFESIKSLVNPMDRDQVVVRSLALSAHYARTQTQTATIEFQPFSRTYDLPSLTPEAEREGVTADKSFDGFTTLNNPTCPVQADLIAVTGFGTANPIKSFSESSNTWDQYLWLRDTLAKDFPGMRIMTYGHDSNAKLGGYLTFEEQAQEFENRLKVLFRDQQARRPVIFIGHSLGGLLVKKALANFKYWGIGNFLTPISPLCIFMGTPHDGLNLEALYSLTLRKPPGALVEELARGSDTLEDVQNEFRMVSGALQILGISEQKPTRTAVEAGPGKWTLDGGETMIVDPSSSRCWLPNERVIGSRTDHRSIAKFTQTSEVYTEVYSAISRFVIPGSLSPAG
ncbi:MAG: hypothetical protein M1814_006125 [Vezdaea aestivalis]|nr:MAG: hypothetical protein M1814_006125 [Vezdaea aestivalis]